MSRDDSAAFASNWWTVLVVDGALGLVALVVGIAISAYGNILALPLILLGGAYDVLVIRRLVRWRRLRHEAGLR